MFLSLGFLLLSLGLVYWALGPGRAWGVQGLRTIAVHPWGFAGVVGGLYLCYALGAGLGLADPQLAAHWSELAGLFGRLQPSRLPLSAGGIFLWNWSLGLLLTTCLPGLLFGLPSLGFNALRNLILGLLLSPPAIGWHLFLLQIPTALFELGGYALGVYGSMLLLFERGWQPGAYSRILSRMGAVLWLATLALLLAAWYEAFSIG